MRLELAVLRPQVPLGGEVALRISLVNDEAAPVDVVSLYNNNVVTNYVLCAADGAPLVTLNHLTRQTLMEKTEPRTGDHRFVTLQPGAAEVRDDNLCRYHWFTGPGEFLVRGLHRWQGQELWSEPQRLEIVAAPLRAYDVRWCHHYGEKFFLRAAWVASLPDGTFELFVRESLRFQPGVINYNRSLGLVPGTLDPRVAFDTTLVARPRVWLAWIEGTSVVALAAGDVAEPAPVVIASGLADPTWVAPPLMTADGGLVLVLCGQGAWQTREVRAIRVDADGNEVGAQVLVGSLPASATISGVTDAAGALHLLWLLGSGEVVHCPVDMTTLRPTAAPMTLWSAPARALGLLTPPVLSEDGYVCCVSVDAASRLRLAWLQPGTTGALKEDALALDDDEEIVGCAGEVDAHGQPRVLLLGRARVRYVHGGVMQARILSHVDDVSPGTARLLVNHRGDVFFGRGDPRIGLRETLVHAGHEEDLRAEEAT